MEIRGFKGQEGPIGGAGASLVESRVVVLVEGSYRRAGGFRGWIWISQFCIPRWYRIGVSITISRVKGGGECCFIIRQCIVKSQAVQCSAVFVNRQWRPLFDPPGLA